MSDVLVHGPREVNLPIPHAKAEEEDEFPDSPPLPVEPIHAIQLFFLLYLLGYLFVSVLLAIGMGNYGFLLMSGSSILALIVGRRLEKKYQNDPVLCRKIAIYVLYIEFVLFLAWQICLFSLFG